MHASLSDAFGVAELYRSIVLGTPSGQHSAIDQDEVFGPVLTALPFDSDEEAIALANDSPYGLAASAWTSDLNRALRCSAEIRRNGVINDHIPIFSEMPHGAYKSSGFGKDMSVHSLQEYSQIKHVAVDRTRLPRKEWHRTILAIGR